MSATDRFLRLKLHARTVSRIADAFLVSIAAGIVLALVMDQFRPISIRLGEWGVVICLCVGLLTVRLWIGSTIKRIDEPLSMARGSYSELIDDLPRPSSKLIESAKEIQIFAGTLVEFVRRQAALQALATAAARGAKIEIIMLDPAGEILQVIAAERSARSGVPASTILERLESECRFSISRLRDVLPPQTAEQALRLSSAMPHQAFERYDDYYLLTPYTFGRGGGSPALFFRRSAANEPLHGGLQRGFEELWRSPLVRTAEGATSP